MFMSIMLLSACGEKDGTDSAPIDIFDTFIFIEVVDDETGEVIDTKSEPSAEDLSCYEPGGTWLKNTADASCITEQAFAGEVEDFETGDEVPDATVEIYFSDTTTGSLDYEGTSDADGKLSGSLTTCTPFSYRVSTDPALEETVTTIQAHEIAGFVSDGSEQAPRFYSVSTTTYNIIPSLLGVTPEPGKGIAAGTAYDCGENPVEFIQVLARDSSGEIIEGQVVKYFRQDFPNRDQYWTSADGLWVIINLPPDTVTVEMYGLNDNGDHDMLGSVVLEVVGDSINIANAFYGYNGGVVYPESCTSACTE